MTSLRFARCIVVVPWLLAASVAALPQQSYVLENSLASYEFEYDLVTGETWLHEAFLKSDPSRVVSFERTSVWDCDLRVDPNALTGISPARGKITQVSDLIGFSGPQSFAGGTGVKFTWTFELAADVDLAEPDPRVTLNSYWLLEPTRDYMMVYADTTLVNPAQTTYRLWGLRHPRLAIENLDASGSGADRLLTSMSGGLLHGNPIRYVDPHDSLGRGFRFSVATEPATGVVNVFNVDPGLRTVPLTYYYNPTFGGAGAPLGLYLANDDDEGIVKGVHIIPQFTASGAPMGLLNYEVVQYPSDPLVHVFDATFAESYCNVHVGVVHGDWVDAAKKYRDYRANTLDEHLDGSPRFAWLKTDDKGTGDPSDDDVPRPSGHPQNPHIAPAMKQSPLQIRLDAGRGSYCLGDLDFELIEAQYRDFIEPFFLAPGEVCPYFLLDRIQVTYDEVGYSPTGGYYEPRTSGVMTEVQQFCQELGNEGHLLLMDSMSEKFWISENPNGICVVFEDCEDEDGTPYSWCCALESELRRLSWESGQMFNPRRSTYTGGNPCPRGKHANLGMEPTFCSSPPISSSPPVGTAWPPIYEDIVADAIQSLNLLGGMRFNSVPASATTCFSEAHDHAAGFSSATMTGWGEVADNIRAKAGVGPDFFATKEYGDSTSARQFRVQNPLSLDIASDLLNQVVPENTPVDEWNRYFDSPVARVPLIQMVADEMRYASQYGKATLALPWTDVFPVEGRDLDGDGDTEKRHFFRRVPAVTGALQCWAMAKRALVHQGGVLVSNGLMPEISHFTGAPDTPEDRALQGMADFYAGLSRFLQAAGLDAKPNMEFVTGTMERAPLLRILGETERFSIPRAVILDPDAPFQRLAQYLTSDYGDGVTFFPAGVDLDFDKYRPAYEELFSLGGSMSAPLQSLPDEHESWLPHGMYRHWDGTDTLALLIANPWGVRQVLAGKVRREPATPFETRPMNPFTFDYLDPAASPASNTYTYEFDFDPAQYEIGPSESYRVERRTYDLAGTLLSTVSLGNFAGFQTFQGTLADFHFQSFYFTTAP